MESYLGYCIIITSCSKVLPDPQAATTIMHWGKRILCCESLSWKSSSTSHFLLAILSNKAKPFCKIVECGLCTQKMGGGGVAPALPLPRCETWDNRWDQLKDSLCLSFLISQIIIIAYTQIVIKHIYIVICKSLKSLFSTIVNAQ